jgi:hypothetical protein
MEEVATMENNTVQRPSLLLAAACAPSALVPSAAPVVVLAAERAPVSQVHQAWPQAELGLSLSSVNGIYGTTGFVGSNGISVKRMTDGASGVPPRGRPV